MKMLKTKTFKSEDIENEDVENKYIEMKTLFVLNNLNMDPIASIDIWSC